jgi:hypothetical protein
VEKMHELYVDQNKKGMEGCLWKEIRERRRQRRLQEIKD